MRSAERISRTPEQWAQERERAQWQAARELTRLLEAARRRGDDWYTWIERRANRQHAHDMTRADGKPAACPVPSCNAVRGERG